MDADNGTYYKAGERWEARGKVHTVNLSTGSTMDGPSLDYLRAVKGVRDTVETYSIGRPTIKYIPKDSAGGKAEPYVIVGDRIRQKGENQVWAGGKVTIDRSDLAARGDSLWLRTGKDGRGSMIGSQPTLRGFGKDTFDLTGQRIDFTLDEKDLTGIMALDSAHAVTGDVDLIGDTVSIALKEKKAEATRAWGKKQRPVGVAGDYELRGDSLAIDTPKGELREVRAYYGALGRHQARLRHRRARLGGRRYRHHPVRRGRLGREEDDEGPAARGHGQRALVLSRRQQGQGGQREAESRRR